VLKVWMPIATTKKNDPNCPVIFNAPGDRSGRVSNGRTDGRMVHTLSAARRSCSDPAAADPLDIYPSADAPDPITEQQTAGILSELGAEEERFSREVLVRRPFEDGGERDRDDEEEDGG
jgi:hypothetical protein